MYTETHFHLFSSTVNDGYLHWSVTGEGGQAERDEERGWGGGYTVMTQEL